ncbi:MAG TPA: P-loop NTPase, partial [Coxiellaceae bacterium]|nr:P-loop NTPase [Coxiellaceae bacterium]
MNTNDIKAILLALRPPILEYLQEDWLTEQQIKKLELAADGLQLELEFGYPIADIRDELSAAIKTELSKQTKIAQINLELRSKIIAHALASAIKPVTQVKNIIAVASGKGGVGKSTTTVNLAAALMRQGARVGILDADIYGPNQPHMLGSTVEKLEVPNGSSFQPKILHNIQSMSMGYLIDANTPIIWRGPMVSSALQQLVSQTAWQNLDYLLIDLPPGTGDIQLTLSQKVPVTAAVIVTTPQDISLLDARKALEMFRKVKVP